MNLQQMKYVVYIAEYHSISRAARKLYVTQPNLSSSIKDLEEEIGIRIFERKKNGVSLTQDGLRFIGRIRPIVEQAQVIEDYYHIETESGNILSVATQHGSLATDIMIELLQKIPMESYQVQLLELKTREVLELLQEGCCDIGILLKNQNNKVMDWEIEQHNLQFHLLTTLKPHVFLQKTHPLADHAILTQEDLEPYPYTKFYQGLDSLRFFSEELVQKHNSDKVITITDKMTNLKLQKQLNAYTIGSGMMSQKTADSSVVVIPYDSDDVIELGWMESKEHRCRDMTAQFVQMMSAYKWA